MGKSFADLRYEIRIRRDVPNNSFFLIAAVLLLIPPILKSVRSGRFEAARWRESDYAPMATQAAASFVKMVRD